MSQCDAKREAQLEIIENTLARYARLKKLLEVIEVKIKFLENQRLRASALEDLSEAYQAADTIQGTLTYIVYEFLDRDIRR
jgi:hypothetical protein